MKKELTTKQLDTLDAINAFIMDRGYSPTLMELAEYFGIQLRAVQDRVDALEKNGFITREAGKQRTIRTVK